MARLACLLLLLLLGGCASVERIADSAASEAGRAAAAEAYRLMADKIPPPVPADGSTELWAVLGSALAVMGHRYWYHWRATKKGGA